MRLLQFWVLMVASCLVSFFYFREIFLTREIGRQQRDVVDRQEAVTEGQAYENAWNQLARAVYISGHNDPALLEILRKEGVEVREASPGTSTVPPPLTQPAPAKSAAASSHPATP